MPCTVKFSVLTLALNAWISARRFQDTAPCVLGCGTGLDEVEHYPACPAVCPSSCPLFAAVPSLQARPLSVEHLLTGVDTTDEGLMIALFIDGLHDACRVARHFGTGSVPGALAVRLKTLGRRWPSLRLLLLPPR